MEKQVGVRALCLGRPKGFVWEYWGYVQTGIQKFWVVSSSVMYIFCHIWQTPMDVSRNQNEKTQHSFIKWETVKVMKHNTCLTFSVVVQSFFWMTNNLTFFIRHMSNWTFNKDFMFDLLILSGVSDLHTFSLPRHLSGAEVGEKKRRRMISGCVVYVCVCVRVWRNGL